MNTKKKIIQIIDRIVNWLIVLCFLPILLYGMYAMWDSYQINQQADASLYETYKPTAKDSLSFAELQKINPDVFGWLTVDKTHIDYPLVQAEDNAKYVNTDIMKSTLMGNYIMRENGEKLNFLLLCILMHTIMSFMIQARIIERYIWIMSKNMQNI